MNNILRKLFLAHNYQVTDISSEFIFSEISNQEYYLTLEYKEEELLNFFDSNKTEEVISYYESIQSQKNDARKNTTLLIYVETNNLEEFFKKNKNTIYKIEEDQFYFRKHIIVYTKNGIQNIDKNSDIKLEINKILIQEDRIDNFSKNFYKDEEFYIAAELMAKIPFLVMDMDDEPYESLFEKVKNEQEILNVQKFTRWLYKEKESDYLDRFEESMLSEEGNQTDVQEFFLKFEEIVE